MVTKYSATWECAGVPGPVDRTMVPSASGKVRSSMGQRSPQSAGRKQTLAPTRPRFQAASLRWGRVRAEAPGRSGEARPVRSLAAEPNAEAPRANRQHWHWRATCASGT
jgi:hypothetical protein